MSRSRSLPSMPYLAGDRSRHRAWARTSVTATLLIVAGALSSTIVAATASASVASDHALASRINMHRTDLPAGAQWTSSPSTPNPPGWVATSHKVIACIQHVAGQALVVSPDPFGLGTAPSGDVTADVTSPTFFVKGPSQLPSADSEVVMTATAVQATADLRAVDRSSALPCLKAAFQAIAVAEQVPAGTKLTLKLLTPPPIRAVATARRLAHLVLRPLLRRHHRRSLLLHRRQGRAGAQLHRRQQVIPLRLGTLDQQKRRRSGRDRPRHLKMRPGRQQRRHPTARATDS